MSNTDLLNGGAETQADSPNSGPADADGEKSAGDPAAQGAEAQSNGAGKAKRRAGGLSGMVIAELRELAGELGIQDTTGMRKGDLIAAIRERQGKSPKRKQAGATPPSDESTPATQPGPDQARVETNHREQARNENRQENGKPGSAGSSNEKTDADSGKSAEPSSTAESATSAGSAERATGTSGGDGQPATRASGPGQPDEGPRRESRRRRGGANRGGGNNQDNTQQRGGDGSGSEQRKQNDRQQNDRQQNDRQQNDRQQNDRQHNDDDERGNRRGRRHRDRRRRSGGRGDGGGPDTEIREDDVLLPIAGILDVLDNYAFVRTSGYLAGPNDVYVSLSLVRKHGLRRGDAITGVVRQPREGEQQRQKFNPLVRVDTINGLEPEAAKKRTEFTKLTPLYPNERLRLETDPSKLTTRVVDLAMPVGKGQRALIVSPPKAGKTTVLQEIANAITTNNPECHLMVVLVDERPEEVTDMERSVDGEVIAATFDRPPGDHTTLAELAIERAKRLVEMGHDVVVLLDSVTRLGRAYNLAAPASGRILSGGVDSTALYPPKRFLGAARNIENGGSLTIFATALVETGSAGDSVIFEEFKGTGNAEIKLDRKIAEKRTFPAVDVNASSTRKEELLLSPEELAVSHKLHRVLHALDSQQAIDLLLDRLRKSKTNIEFLTQVAKTTPGQEEE